MSEVSEVARYEIRPLSLSETLDTGFQLLKKHVGVLFPLSVVGQIPTVIFTSAFAWMLDPFAFEKAGFPELGASFLVAIAFYALAMLLLLPVVIGAITSAVGAAYLGTKLSLADCLRQGAGRMFPLIISYLIFSVIILVGFLALFVLVGLLFGLGAATLPESGFGTVLGGILILAMALVAIPAFLALAGLLSLLPCVLAAVVMLEGRSMFDAVARTFSLVTAELGRMTGLGMVLYLFVMVVPTGMQFVVGSIPIFGAVVLGLANALAQAYLFTTAVVAYFDVRCRLESFDLEHLAQLVEGNASSVEAGR